MRDTFYVCTVRFINTPQRGPLKGTQFRGTQDFTTTESAAAAVRAAKAWGMKRVSKCEIDQVTFDEPYQTTAAAYLDRAAAQR